MEVLRFTSVYVWIALGVALMRVVVPHVTALIALAMALRGTEPSERSALLARYTDCLRYWLPDNSRLLPRSPRPDDQTPPPEADPPTGEPVSESTARHTTTSATSTALSPTTDRDETIGGS